MPMMIPGDMIITNTVNPVNLEVGDVIAFQDPHATYKLSDRLNDIATGQI